MRAPSRSPQQGPLQVWDEEEALGKGGGPRQGRGRAFPAHHGWCPAEGDGHGPGGGWRRLARRARGSVWLRTGFILKAQGSTRGFSLGVQAPAV